MIRDARRKDARSDPWSHRPRIACGLGRTRAPCRCDRSACLTARDGSHAARNGRGSLDPAEHFAHVDSGLRRTPDSVLSADQSLAAKQRHQQELRPVPTLASELGIHKSTLEAAIRTGRLRASFSVRSAFGRPIRRVKRMEAQQFMLQVYGRRSEGRLRPRRETPLCSHGQHVRPSVA